MSRTIYPILAKCLLPKEVTENPSEAASNGSFRYEQIFGFLSEKAGWNPLFPNVPVDDCVCISDDQLTLCVLPDGKAGYLYIPFQDYFAEEDEKHECFLIDAYGNDREFVLTGFTLNGDEAKIQYAAQEDLRAIYNGRGQYIPGVTETATFPSMQKPGVKEKVCKGVTNSEREYLLESADSCLGQGFNYERLVFEKVVPVPADLFD